MEKIERWKKDESVNDFFLHEPIQRLMPFLNVSDMSLQQYSALQQQIDKAQLENIYTSLSASQRQTFSNAMQRYFTQEMKPN